MKLKARIVLTVTCSCVISLLILSLVNNLHSFKTHSIYGKCVCNRSGVNMLSRVTAKDVSETVIDRRVYLFKRNNTEHVPKTETKLSGDWTVHPTVKRNNTEHVPKTEAKLSGDGTVHPTVKRNETEHYLDRHVSGTNTKVSHDQTNYPMALTVGTLVSVVRENDTTEVQQRVGRRYNLIKRIGGGVFGHIFLGVDMKNGEKVAVKIDRSEKINSTVSKESMFYQILQGGEGFPAIRWSGKEGKYDVMVIDLLGPNLQTYFEHCRYRFSVKTVLLLADQMISRLEYLHYKGFIHRDLSPGNFVVGQGINKSTLYIIDFGLSQRYRDPKTGRHVPYRHVGYTGTDRYCSLKANEGYQQSRRDDMEALGYIFVYFLKGRLPWQGVETKVKSEKVKQVFHIKQSTTPGDLCRGLPMEFSQYMNITRSFKFEEEPDYSRLRNLFKNVLKRQNVTENLIFDWDVVNGTCKTSRKIQ